MNLKEKEFARYLLGCFGLAIASLLAVALIDKSEAVLFINGFHTPLLDRLLIAVTFLGDGIVFIPVIAALLFVRFHDSVVIAIAAVTTGIICAVLKQVVFADAPRPAAVINDDLLHFVPGVHVHLRHSFPSGHSATIFCLSLLLSLIFQNKTLAGVLLVLSLAVGYSRVYLLQHFVGDVAVGAVIGTLLAFGTWTISQRVIGRTAWSNGRLQINVRRGDYNAAKS